MVYKLAAWLSNLTGIRGDYILHFGVCISSTFVVGLVSFLLTYALFGVVPAIVASLLGAAFATGLSIGKESGDKNNPNSGWSWRDLLADALGILAGLIALAITILITLT